MTQYIIGIDVGGTNTDAVLTCEGGIIASAKTVTTTDINIGIAETIKKVFELSQVQKDKIKFVMIGTTHLLNATLQNRLNKVAVIRLGYPATTAIPPCTGWPSEIEKNVKAKSYIINGGYEYNGKPISNLDEEQLKNIAFELKDYNFDHVAITGVFSHINPNQEKEAAQILKKYNPLLKIILSHEMGGLGLLERENATILNTALLPIYQNVCDAIQQTVQNLGLNQASVCLSHNDGSIDPIQTLTENRDEQQKPILTINAGSVNSIRGAASIAQQMGIKNIIVADIGGTSTDVGLIRNGAAIEINSRFSVAGIPLNQSCISSESIALGGGSKVIIKENENIAIGPESVGLKLKEEAICFGGKTLTATDIAVFKGRITGDNIIKKSGLYAEQDIEKIDNILHEKLAAIIRETWLSTQEKPDVLMLVGGGSNLFEKQKLLHLLKDKINKIVIPANANVANALGAAQGEISGIHTKHFDFEKINRQQAIKEVYLQAVAKAIKKGAELNSIKEKFRNEEEIQYVPGKQTLVTIKVAGQIQTSQSLDNKSEFNIETQQKFSNHNIQNNTNDKNNDQLTQLSHCENKEVNSTELSNEIVNEINHTSKMTQERIKDKEVGHGILGSGGGGDTRLPAFMVNDCIKNGKEIKIIPLENLADDATVICFGIMGSPSVCEEKLPSKEEMGNAILNLQNRLGKKIDAIVSVEIGGANGLLPLVAAAELGVPVVDADCMGRALPALDMVTPIIEEQIHKHIAALACGTGQQLIEAENAQQLEEKAREYTDKMGGVTFIAYMPMFGITAKKVCIPGTHSIAEKIGSIFNNNKNAGSMMNILNNYLKTTEYKEIKEEFNGRIGDLKLAVKNAYSVGGVVCANDHGEEVEVIFKNEYLKLRKKLNSGNYQDLTTAPDLIVIADQETMRPISCGQLKYGQRVRILSLKAPSQLLKEKAEKVVGPKAYRLDESIKLLHPDEFAN